ncbi:MAG: S41 family peptidase [Minicystis sp.]
MMKRLAATSSLLAVILAGASARAGTFDAVGSYRIDPGATAGVGFEKDPDRYLPADAGGKCEEPMFTVVSGADAIEGDRYAELRVNDGCAERFQFPLPAEQASYRASVWMRHGGLDASIVVVYADGSGLDTTSAQMSPTGRTTSDGWVELASNEFPVDGAKVAHAYLRVVSYAATDAVHIDGLEVVRSGEFTAQSDCSGLGDPVCGTDGVCVYGRCVIGRLAVPILPSDAVRNDMVDVLASQLRLFFGGRYSRLNYLPVALAQMEAMRKETTAWGFWSRWATAIHALHDWHTDTYTNINPFVGTRHRLNACFIEGDADRSHGVVPKDPKYADILVSHVGPDAAGLSPGDRLIAVDGMHPIAWAASLADANWGYHVATDPGIYADFAESLGGPVWGGALILRYAHEITVLRCDAGGCAGKPETIAIASLGNAGGGADVACDNRPLYHFVDGNPEADKHYVFGDFFRGRIAGSAPDEAIYGMVWDTLYGGGDPNGPVNTAINAAIADWKANARGVILDHRAGNGGTIDAATNLTRLVRPPAVAGVMRQPISIAAYDGPVDDAAGLAIFNAKKGGPTAYDVGDADWAVGLPVALIIHRDGSASDYLPYGMKGAPNVRIFGPHATAGAFSTFIEFSSWGGLYYQIASGDTIGAGGSALIGHGVEPDVTLLPKQSDLIAGKDTLFEAALAWVRQELKP